jgi:hypothetical protein
MPQISCTVIPIVLADDGKKHKGTMHGHRTGCAESGNSTGAVGGVICRVTHRASGESGRVDSAAPQGCRVRCAVLPCITQCQPRMTVAPAAQCCAPCLPRGAGPQGGSAGCCCCCCWRMYSRDLRSAWRMGSGMRYLQQRATTSTAACSPSR